MRCFTAACGQVSVAASETNSSDTRSTWSPWLIQTCVSCGDAGEQVGGSGFDASIDQLRPAILAGRGALHFAAERLAHQLHAVADAEHRDAELEDLRIALRRAVGVHARRAAGEDQPLRRELAHPLGRDVVPHDLAVHVLLADPAGDQLDVLRAEVEHEHPLGGDVRGERRRQAWRATRVCEGNGAL